MPRSLSPALVLLLSCAISMGSTGSTGCGSGSGGGGGAGARGENCPVSGYRCTTPACSVLPTTNGCVDVAPKNGYCPVELPRCFSPTDDAHIKWYCDPKGWACAKPKDAPPAECKNVVQPCSRAELDRCWDSNTDIFCRGDWVCTRFFCPMPDAGVDASPDAAGPSDASMPDGG